MSAIARRDVTAPSSPSVTAPRLWIEPDALGVPTVWCEDPRPGRGPAALLTPHNITQRPPHLADQATVEVARAALWAIVEAGLETRMPPPDEVEDYEHSGWTVARWLDGAYVWSDGVSSWGPLR